MVRQERLFTKDFILDTAISLCCSLNYFTLLINITGFATVTFGATSAEGGLAAGLYVIGGLISRVCLGKYVEMVGRKKMLIFGLVIALVMSVTYFFVSSMAMLYVIRFLHGTAYGLSSTCTNDIIAKIVPQSRRGEGLGYFLLSITIATAIGPFLGMTFGQNGNYEAVFTVGLVMYSAALFLALLLRVPEETLTEEQKAQARSFKLREMFQFTAVPLALTCMVFYFSYSGVLSFISSYAEDIDLVSAATYFYLAVAVGTLISRLTTGRIYDVRGPNIVMYPAYVAFFIGMVAFSQASAAWVLLCAGFVIGYGVSIVYSIDQAIVVSKSPAHRYGVTTSTFAAIVDLGSGLGPSVLGLVLSFAGYREMYLICAFVSLVSLLMYWFIHGRNHGRNPGKSISVQE